MKLNFCHNVLMYIPGSVCDGMCLWTPSAIFPFWDFKLTTSRMNDCFSLNFIAPELASYIWSL